MNEPETTTVVAGDASATVAEAAKKPKARSAPKWETEARDRLKTAIRRYSSRRWLPGDPCFLGCTAGGR